MPAASGGWELPSRLDSQTSYRNLFLDCAMLTGINISMNDTEGGILLFAVSLFFRIIQCLVSEDLELCNMYLRREKNIEGLVSFHIFFVSGNVILFIQLFSHFFIFFMYVVSINVCVCGFVHVGVYICAHGDIGLPLGDFFNCSTFIY